MRNMTVRKISLHTCEENQNWVFSVCVHEIKTRRIRWSKWLLLVSYKTCFLKTGLGQKPSTFRRSKSCKTCSGFPLFSAFMAELDEYIVSTVVLVGGWHHILPLNDGSQISVLIPYLFIFYFQFHKIFLFPYFQVLWERGKGKMLVTSRAAYCSPCHRCFWSVYFL